MVENWEEMNKRLIELEEQTRLKINELSNEIAKRDDKIKELDTQIDDYKEKLDNIPTHDKIDSIVKEIEDGIAIKEEKMRKKYLEEIAALKVKICDIEDKSTRDLDIELKELQKTKEALVSYKRDIEERFIKLEERVSSSEKLKGELNEQQENVESLKSEKTDLEGK
ncbi:MAG: hypothetical protein HWN65_18415 [Candidatus Helarchaeota archaeon]|nr:hypothetical protein [Candidatus Helarchaeota archaeon]